MNMNAMVLERPDRIESSPLRLRSIPIPELRPDEILVRVKSCGICRTDLHIVEGELPPQSTSIVPGHQIVGIVEKIGSNATQFKVGDRVGIAWLRDTCGHCRYCLDGNENLCTQATFTGYHDNGGFAEFARVRADFAYRLTDRVDPAFQAPLLCAGIIGYRALRRANVLPNSRVGLYGFGSSAHVALQVARYWGCKVFVMTRDARHQQLARELGADWVGHSNESPAEKLDSAILFAPVGELVPIALDALEWGGTLALAGIYLTDVPSLNYEKHLFHEKTLRSVTANTRRDGQEFIQLAIEIPLKPQITRFPLEEANQALLALKRDEIRGSGVLVIDPN